MMTSFEVADGKASLVDMVGHGPENQAKDAPGGRDRASLRADLVLQTDGALQFRGSEPKERFSKLHPDRQIPECFLTA